MTIKRAAWTLPVILMAVGLIVLAPVVWVLIMLCLPGFVLIGTLLVNGRNLDHLRRRPDFGERLGLAKIAIREGKTHVSRSPTPLTRTAKLIAVPSPRRSRPSARLEAPDPSRVPLWIVWSLALGGGFAFGLSGSRGELNDVFLAVMGMSTALFAVLGLVVRRLARPWSGSPYSRGIGPRPTHRNAGDTPDPDVKTDFPGLYRSPGG